MLYTEIILSDNSHHSSPRLFRVTAPNAALAVLALPLSWIPYGLKSVCSVSSSVFTEHT